MYTLEEKKDVLIVKPRFDLEVANLHIFKEMTSKIEDWVGEEEGRCVVLDLDEVKYVDSVGLGNILRTHERVRKKGGRLFLVGAHGYVKDMVISTSLDKIIPCLEDIKDVATYPKLEQ